MTERRNQFDVDWISERFGVTKEDNNLMCHFFEDKDCYRARDSQGNEGWVVGYREFVESLPGSRVKGFGGQALFLEDGPLQTLYSISKSQLKRI